MTEQHPEGVGSPDRGRDRDHGHDHGHDHGDHGHRRGLWASIRHLVAPHRHHVGDAIDRALEDSHLGERVTKQTLVVKLAGAGVQLAIVAISGSLALMADMLHSFADASTTIPLWIAFVLGRREASSRFPHGYRRAEDLAGVFIVAVIMATSVLVIWESYQRLRAPTPITNLPWVGAAAVVGIVVNEYVARRRIRVGRRIGSSALVADGLHARTDTLSSAAVLVAVAGVALGYDLVDSLVGFVVAAIILWMMKGTALQIGLRLMDGVEPGTLEEISVIGAEVDGVETVDAVRARWAGHRMMVEVIVAVDPDQSVRAGHLIAEQVRHEVLHGAQHVHDVLVHVNPAVSDDDDDPHALTRHHRRTRPSPRPAGHAIAGPIPAATDDRS